MGLPEKRRLEELKSEKITEYSQKIKQITDKSIAFDVKWDSFADDIEALDNLEHQGFGRLLSAVRTICHDKIGLDSFNKAVKTIKFQNLKSAKEKKLSYKDGVLTICAAWGQGTDGYFTDTEIQRLLEEHL